MIDASQPQVFISFSSQDVALANALKAKLVAATQEEVTFFLAADGVSMPAGTNWPKHLEQSLERADLIIVLMSYAAAASQWVFFEAGFAYAKGKPVIPVGILGLQVQNQPPPISLLQGVNIGSAADLNLLLRFLNTRLMRSYPEAFADSDYDEIFAGQPPQHPAPRTLQLLSRAEIYKDIAKELAGLNIHSQVRVTATMHDPSEYEDDEFQSYIQGLARKCATAEAHGGSMTYRIIIGITREANGSIPDLLRRAIAYRVSLFQQYGALPRLKLFEITQRWSLNLLFFDRAYVVFGFPEDMTVPRLQYGFRMSGLEFVSPVVDWYDRVEREAKPLALEEFL